MDFNFFFFEHYEQIKVVFGHAKVFLNIHTYDLKKNIVFHNLITKLNNLFS